MRAKIKPADGRLVLDPNSKEPLPPEGKEVELTVYWHRRLYVGDVVKIEDEKGGEE